MNKTNFSRALLTSPLWVPMHLAAALLLFIARILAGLFVLFAVGVAFVLISLLVWLKCLVTGEQLPEFMR